MSRFKKYSLFSAAALAVVYIAGFGKWNSMLRLKLAGFNPTFQGMARAVDENEASPQMIRQFLKAGIDADSVNESDNNETPVLQQLILRGKVKHALALINHGVIKGTDATGRTALMTACGSVSEFLVSQLLKMGADVNSVDAEGMTALHYLWAGKMDVISRCCSDDGAIIEERPLGWPERERRQTEILAALLAKGADPNKRDKSGRSPLSIAVAEGNYEQVEMILKKAGTVDLSPDRFGQTVLHIAAERSDDMMLKMLLEGVPGAVELVNKKDKYDATPLLLVKDKISLMRLVKAGGRVNAVDREGDTLLNILVKKLDEPPRNEESNREINQLILQALKSGADPNIPNHAGDRSVFLSAAKCDLTSSLILLEYGAKIHSMREFKAAARIGCSEDEDYRKFLKGAKERL